MKTLRRFRWLPRKMKNSENGGGRQTRKPRRSGGGRGPGSGCPSRGLMGGEEAHREQERLPQGNPSAMMKRWLNASTIPIRR